MAADPNDIQTTDELDPELVKLARRPTHIRPIMAVALIAICLILIFRIVDDLTFSRQGEARLITDISELNEGLLDHHIEIEVTPDRQQAVRMLPSNKTAGPVFMPVLGESQTLWLLVHPTPWTEEIRADEVYRGRLQKFSDMDFYDELRRYFGQKHNVPRLVSLTEIRKVLSGQQNKIHDLAGDTFPVEDSTSVHFQEVSTTTLRIRARSSVAHSNAEQWQLALQSAGLLAPNHTDPINIVQSPDSWFFDIPIKSGIEEIRETLAKTSLFAAKVEELVVTRDGTWSDLSLRDGEILLNDVQHNYTVKNISLGLPIKIPTSTYFLNTTENPDTYWYIPILVIALAFFVAFFTFGIYQYRQHSQA